MNDIERFIAAHKGRKLLKLAHYAAIYERHFARFRGGDAHVLEIGVADGGSLQMWKAYFGARAVVHGIDINPHCRRAEEDRIHVHIGDQSDRAFLRSVAAGLPRLDVVIDDGGHRMHEQRIAFEELFPRLEDGGIYLCEDLHTSYLRQYDGGYRGRGSFVEFGKSVVDMLNRAHFEGPIRHGGRDLGAFPVRAVHFYDSVAVFEKGAPPPLRLVEAGVDELPEYAGRPRPFLARLARYLRRKAGLL